MNRKKYSLLFLLAITISWQSTSVSAQSVDQSISLNAGWNAIFLEVDPTDPDPAVVFSGIAANLVSVWAWNPVAGTVEFVQDPNQLVDGGPQMLVYRPGNPIVSNLSAIDGNKAYIVEMSAPDTLTVTGEPQVPDIDWKPNSFNFVGFHVDGASPPWFQDFFAGSPAHAGQEIYVLDNATGSWRLVTDEPMQEGEGFWVYCHGSSTFNGALSVQLEQGNSLEFGSLLTVQDIVLKNDSQSDQTANLAISAGSAPVYYWMFDPATGQAEWMPFPPAPVDIAAGEYQRMRIGVKRDGLGPVPVTANIGVSGSGMNFDIPLSLVGTDLAGLWVGEARINQVAELGSTNNPTPTGSEFSFHLLLHVDSTGQTQLLNQVIQMWQAAEWIPDPDDLGRQIVDQPGQAVLFTDDALIPNYSGTSLRDGQPVARRISAPAFGNFYVDESFITRVNQKAMVGSFGADEQNLMITLGLPADDASNPFVHQYHPDHLKGQDCAAAPERCFDITRVITLTFSDKDWDGKYFVGTSGLGWGSLAIGGRYQEEISGLVYNNPIMIRGTFQLHKASSIDTLTTN